MKNRLFLSLLILSISFSAIADGVILKKINKQAVKKHEDSIAKEIYHHTWMKRGALLAGVGAAAGLIGYSYLKSDQKEKAETQSPMTAEQAKEIQYNLQKLAGMNPVERKGFLSRIWGWGKTTGNMFLQNAAVAILMRGAFGPLEKYFKVINKKIDDTMFNAFHPRNLRWFTLAHARVEKLFEQLEEYALSIENGVILSEKDEPVKNTINWKTQMNMLQAPAIKKETITLSDEERSRRIKALKSTWNLIITKMEALLGFMNYQLNQYVNTSKNTAGINAMQNVTTAITSIINSSAVSLNVLFSNQNEEVSYKGLHEEVVRCHLLFNAEQERFSLLEKE